jgi:hypothetical protein
LAGSVSQTSVLRRSRVSAKRVTNRFRSSPLTISLITD